MSGYILDPKAYAAMLAKAFNAATPFAANRSTSLTRIQRNHLPGWLLRLIDSRDVHAIGYAERHCSDRYFIRLLAERRRELEAET